MLFQRYSTKWVYFYISFIFMMFHWCFHQNTSVKTQKYLRAHNLNNLVSCCYITFSEHTLKKQKFFWYSFTPMFLMNSDPLQDVCIRSKKPFPSHERLARWRLGVFIRIKRITWWWTMWRIITIIIICLWHSSKGNLGIALWNMTENVRL